MPESVLDLVKEINDHRTSVASNSKDEVRVMKAMLNDPTFIVDVYGRTGVEGQYCPYTASREMVANIIRDTTRISKSEATDLANSYDFSKGDATTFVEISKQFVNTYVDTGRKLPFGGRENSNIKISKKIRESRPNVFTQKIGVNEDGTDRYEQVENGTIPEFKTIKVYSSCPPWMLENKN